MIIDIKIPTTILPTLSKTIASSTLCVSLNNYHHDPTVHLPDWSLTMVCTVMRTEMLQPIFPILVHWGGSQLDSHQ